MPLVARLRRALGPLSPLVVFFGAGLLFLSASRASLTLAHLGRIEKVEGAWRLFAVGLRMDSITLSIALFVPTPVLLLLPRRGSGLWKPVLATYFALVAALVVFMEVVTLPFMAQYDGRPNRIFIDYLAYPHEVAATVWADQKPTVVLALLLVGCTLRLAWRQARALLDDHRWWSSGWRLLALPPFAALVFLGARSTLGHRGANISTAAFSGDHLANELALNSTYSLGYAVYTRRTEIDAHRLYGGLPRRDVLARVRRQMLLPPGAFTRDDLPTLHRQTSARVRTRPYNLVILLEESLGAQYVGSLGGLDLTPNLDRLATEGLFLTNLYATGTRTVRGIEATVTGFLPMAGDSVA